MNTKTMNLDPEEQSLLDSFERGEWQSVKDLPAQKKMAVDAARRFLKIN